MAEPIEYRHCPAPLPRPWGVCAAIAFAVGILHGAFVPLAVFSMFALDGIGSRPVVQLVLVLYAILLPLPYGAMRLGGVQVADGILLQLCYANTLLYAAAAFVLARVVRGRRR